MPGIRRLPTVLMGILALVALAACGTGGNEPDSEDEVVVPDTTKVVDGETADALLAVQADGTLRFARETSVLASLEEGDVLVAGIIEGPAPDGFLRSVSEARTTEGGEVVVESEQATLTDAIDQASVRYRRALGSDDVAGTQDHVEGVRLVPQQGGKAFGLDMSETLVSIEGAEVRVDGEVNIDADLIFELDIDKSQPFKPATWVKRFKAAAALDEEVDLTLHAEGTLDKSAERELKTVNIASIEFLIGPVPVVIAADLTFFLEFDGTVSAELTTRVTQSASLEAGGLYERDSGWSGVNETSSSLAHEPPSFQASAEARAAAGARVAVGLYGEQGAAGTITGRAFLDAEAQTDAFPLWCIYGGLNASYGYQVSVPVINVDLAKYDETFAELREEIACAANNDPEIAITSPGDGASFEEATEVVFEADASDAESAPEVFWEVSGRDLSGSGATFSVRRLCPGDHTVTATAEDGQGATVTAQVTVTITNRAPDVTIQEAPDAVGETNEFALKGTARDPTCDDLGGTRVNLDRLIWDLEDGQGGTGPGFLTLFTAQGTKTVTLSYRDEHGAEAETSSTIEVGAFDPDADPVVVITEPQEGQYHELRGDTDPCHAIDVAAQASASVSDEELIWTRDLGSGEAQFATGRDATLELSCSDIVSTPTVDLAVRAEGESAASARDEITIEVETVGL